MFPSEIKVLSDPNLGSLTVAAAAYMRSFVQQTKSVTKITGADLPDCNLVNIR